MDTIQNLSLKERKKQEKRQCDRVFTKRKPGLFMRRTLLNEVGILERHWRPAVDSGGVLKLRKPFATQGVFADSNLSHNLSVGFGTWDEFDTKELPHPTRPAASDQANMDACMKCWKMLAVACRVGVRGGECQVASYSLGKEAGVKGRRRERGRGQILSHKKQVVQHQFVTAPSLTRASCRCWFGYKRSCRYDCARGCRLTCTGSTSFSWTRGKFGISVKHTEARDFWSTLASMEVTDRKEEKIDLSWKNTPWKIGNHAVKAFYEYWVGICVRARFCSHIPMSKHACVKFNLKLKLL